MCMYVSSETGGMQQHAGYAPTAVDTCQEIHKPDQSYLLGLQNGHQEHNIHMLATTHSYSTVSTVIPESLN